MKNVSIITAFAVGAYLIFDVSAAELNEIGSVGELMDKRTVLPPTYTELKEQHRKGTLEDAALYEEFLADGVRDLGVRWGADDSCCCSTTKHNCLRIVATCCRRIGELFWSIGLALAGADAFWPEWTRDVESCSVDLKNCMDSGLSCGAVDSTCNRAASLTTLRTSYEMSVASAVLNCFGPALVLVGRSLELGYDIDKVSPLQKEKEKLDKAPQPNPAVLQQPGQH